MADTECVREIRAVEEMMGGKIHCFTHARVRGGICSSVTNIPSWTDWAITKTGHVREPFVALEKAGHCPLDPTAHVLVIFSGFL